MYLLSNHHNIRNKQVFKYLWNIKLMFSCTLFQAMNSYNHITLCLLFKKDFAVSFIRNMYKNAHIYLQDYYTVCTINFIFYVVLCENVS